MADKKMNELGCRISVLIKVEKRGRTSVLPTSPGYQVLTHTHLLQKRSVL